MKILFLCKGNVGRSVCGEYLYNTLTGTQDAHSAGTLLTGPEQSLVSLLPKTQFAINTMGEEGADVRGHIRRLVTQEMVNEADIIIDMAQPETVPDFVKAHPDRRVWVIDDPKDTSMETHIRVRDEIKEKIKETFDTN
ncbi:MAG: low molecular weight phosphatase family protein [Patescibacteria group bacterium]|nr:low molecular weight phosphatase family protein [Patescibacteria group bacterium]